MGWGGRAAEFVCVSAPWFVVDANLPGIFLRRTPSPLHFLVTVAGDRSPTMAQQPKNNIRNVCWATNSRGNPCGKKCSTRKEASGIPYCDRHLKVGDEAFKSIMHDEQPEIFGQILIAKFPIPRNYKLIYWGKLWRSKDVPTSADDHTIDFCPNEYSDRVYGTIDPTPYSGSIAQFASCVGPGELRNMAPDSIHFGDWGKNRTPCAGRVYKITKDIPIGHQVVHDYGAGWMEDRNIKRLNSGTKKHPVGKREPRKPRGEKRKMDSSDVKVKGTKKKKANKEIA